MSKRSASRSTILPLPSSPHWAPMTTMILDMIQCRLQFSNFRFVRCSLKRETLAIGNRKWLACFSQSNWFFDEVISAGAANFFNVASFDWKEAAEIGPVLVYAAGA